MFLGVGGGGTKTAFCLLDSAGVVRARVNEDGAYYFAENGPGGVDHVIGVLKRGIDATCEQAGITPADIDHTFLGLPGYGEAPGDVAALDAAPSRILGSSRYTVDNDMICGWAGSLGTADGINVISGTGSMVYGERDGRGVRIGGWSEMFSDEGSAYWIAVRALNAFTAQLRATEGTYDLRTPLFAPVFGAALHAAKLAGTPLSPAALITLRSGAADSADSADSAKENSHDLR